MKITLIWPNVPEKSSSLYPPLGLSYIAAMLEKHGYDPGVVDLTFEENADSIPYDSDIYGISCTTPNFKRVSDIADKIKEDNPGCIIVVGGPHATILPLETASQKSIDIACVGEGEMTFLEIVQRLENNKGYDDVKGIAFKKPAKKSGSKGSVKVEMTAPREPIEDLDSIPFPDQGKFPLEKYFKLTGLRQLSILTTRGCPGNCTFCQPTLRKLFGPRLRYRSARKVVQEIEEMMRKYRLDMVSISDDTFTWHVKNVEEMCRLMVERKVDVIWRCQTRVNTPKETFRWMKRAGCVGVAFGVESGSEKILENIQKYVKVEDIRKAFEDCHSVGMLTHAYLMVGNVGESRHTVDETIALLRQIRPFNINVSITTPYPGTQLYDYAIKNGLILTQDWDKYNHITNEAAGMKLDNLTLRQVHREKGRIESFFEVFSKGYKTRQLVRSLSFDMAMRMARITLKNPLSPWRLLKFEMKTVSAKSLELFR